jgi:hypothetical protein
MDAPPAARGDPTPSIVINRILRRAKKAVTRRHAAKNPGSVKDVDREGGQARGNVAGTALIGPVAR